MSELQDIERAVAKAGTRRRVHRGWKGLWKGLLAAALIWLIPLALQKLVPLPDGLNVAAGLAALSAPVIGFLAGWARQPTLLQTARWIDEQSRFQERLSTALEMNAANAKPSAWGRLVLADAAPFLQKLNLRAILPFRVPEHGKWVIVLLAVAFGLGFAPEYRSEAYRQAVEESENIQDTGQRLIEFARAVRAARPPSLEQTRKTMDDVENLGQRLSSAKLTRSEALADIGSVADKVKDELSRLGDEPGMRRLRDAAKAPLPGAGAAEGLQKKIEALQRELGPAAGQSSALESLRRDLAKMKSAAAGMQNEAAASSETTREMADALADLSQKAAQLGLNLPDLESAIAALNAGRIDQFLKELNQATQDLQETLDMAKALAQMQMQLAESGRTLAQQLERGQAQEAASRLRSMADALVSAALTQDELEKILKELSDALQPAELYGQVGDLLKLAARQANRGDKAAAAEAMRQAARELEEMLKSFAAAQGLNAQLQALMKAQMCVGNCVGWGQCLSPRTGAGQSGGMSPYGVGTWANDDGGWRWFDYSQLTAEPNNADVQRPDMDPRGLSDRGPGQAPAGLIPDRVKGQFSQGGPMPSIPLKGLHIKGAASAEYTEAVAAAQSAAQSALNHDQVPRAYRGAVRDYFDDIRPSLNQPASQNTP